MARRLKLIHSLRPVVKLGDLETFVVRAKSATYVGSGLRAESAGSARMTSPSKAKSGSTATATSTVRDFLGQETVWFQEKPAWAENYYGYILRPDLIDAEKAGRTIKAALSAMYQEGRFLGGFDWSGPHGQNQDRSSGDVSHFHVALLDAFVPGVGAEVVDLSTEMQHGLP
jgi:hypothetical protein